jgi:hypothetical protein
MKKAFLAVAAAAPVAAATLSVPTTADARCRSGCAAGIAAGVVGAAIVGSAIANSAPRGGYVVYQGYAAPYPRYCPGGYWARQRLYNRHGNFVGWSEPAFICP